MTTPFTSAAGHQTTEQQAGSELDYTLDWSDALDPEDAISGSAWVGTTGIVIDRLGFTDTTATAWVSGGVGGKWYEVRNTVTTASGRVHVRIFRVYVRGALATGATLFTDPVAAVASMRRDRLMGPASMWLAGASLSDEYVLGKLLAAERAIERRLRVFFSPVEVIPAFAPQEERDALDEAGTRWVDEPGYDIEPVTLGVNSSWGTIELRHAPVITVHSVKFNYLGFDGPSFDVPSNWIRLDRKYGRLQIVPVQLAGVISFSGLMLGALTNGRKVPLAIQVRYRAGLKDAAKDYPDLLNLIHKMAVLDVLDDQFLPSSGSSSVDGLSQSASWDSKAHRDGLDRQLTRLADSLSGIRLTVL